MSTDGVARCDCCQRSGCAELCGDLDEGKSVYDTGKIGEHWRHTGGGAVIVWVTVFDAESLRQAHAEEISATANLSNSLGAVRAFRSWTAAAMGATSERLIGIMPVGQ